MAEALEGSEFVFKDADFEFLRALVAEHAGIIMADSKRDLVYGRLVRRLRRLGLRRFCDYCDLLRDPTGDEMEFFVNALTTNLTSFFREPHHFEFIRSSVMPQLIAQKTQKKIRVWSAGCSTGEEPYSLAMVLAEEVPGDWDVKVLATDLDSQVIAQGERGIYTRERVSCLSPGQLKRWFKKGRGAHADEVKVDQSLRDLIVFKQLNLMNSWPMKGKFDFIFCRNVVIYFDKNTQKTLVGRYRKLLHDGGYLFLGHSESLFQVSDEFQVLGNTIYQRI